MDTTTPPRRRLPVLTQSSLGTLLRCEELFRLKYLEGLRPMETPPHFSVGTGFHAGIEHQDPEAGVRALVEARGPAYSDQERDALERDSWVVRAMVEGALVRWDDWPERAEVPFRIPLRNPTTGGTSTVHVLGGVVDGVYDESKLLELKTSSRVDRDYIARLALDFQVTMYLGAMSRVTGAPVREVVYRIVKKPGLRPRKGETDTEHAERVQARKPLSPLKQRKGETEESYQERSQAREDARPPLKRKVAEDPEEYGRRVLADYRARPDNYFHEVLVTRTTADLLRFEHEVWSLHERVLELEGGAFPVRNVKSCLDFGRCAFFDLCTGQVGTDAFRVIDNPNPELPETTP